MGGVKYDKDKLRMELITPEMYLGLAEVLTYGANKYGDRNWENGISNDRLIAAAMRHLVAWMSGEKTDEESGLSHLAHAMANLGFMLTFEKRGEKQGEFDFGLVVKRIDNRITAGPNTSNSVADDYFIREELDKMRGK